MKELKNVTPQHLIALARAIEGEPQDFDHAGQNRLCDCGCGRYVQASGKVGVTKEAERVCKRCRTTIADILRAEADRRSVVETAAHD